MLLYSQLFCACLLSPAALTRFINPYFFLLSLIFSTSIYVSVQEICSATVNSLVILWVLICVSVYAIQRSTLDDVTVQLYLYILSFCNRVS